MLIKYLSREGGKAGSDAKFVILGHSTGCQDAVAHCKSYFLPSPVPFHDVSHLFPLSAPSSPFALCSMRQAWSLADCRR